MMNFQTFKTLLETECDKRRGEEDKGFKIIWVSYLVEGSEDFDKGCQDCLMRSFNSLKEEENYLDEDIIVSITDKLVGFSGDGYGVEYETDFDTHEIKNLGWRDLDEYLCEFELSEDAPSIVSGRLEFPDDPEDAHAPVPFGFNAPAINGPLYGPQTAKPLGFTSDMMKSDEEKEAFNNLMKILQKK